MGAEHYLDEQKDIALNFLRDRFGVNWDELPDGHQFVKECLKAIVSLKIWINYLEKTALGARDSIAYAKEIVSNVNHIIVMGPLGLKIPSALMIRRSLEGVLHFLYYKDHPVEFCLREAGVVDFHIIRTCFS